MGKLIGWGRTNDSVTSLAKVLQEIDLPVVTTPTCQLRPKDGLHQLLWQQLFLASYGIHVVMSDFLTGKERATAIMIRVSVLGGTRK